MSSSETMTDLFFMWDRKVQFPAIAPTLTLDFSHHHEAGAAAVHVSTITRHDDFLLTISHSHDGL